MSRYTILEPYTRRVDDTRHRVSRVLLYAALITFAMVMGFTVALLPIDFLIVPLIPIILLFALALWMAPDIDPELDGAVRKLFLTFLAIAMVWPDYVAVTMPGIGWLSFARIAMGLSFLFGLYAIATSSRVRATIYDIISQVKPLYWSFLLLFILQWLLAFATASLTGRLLFAQIFWYYVFIVSAWVFAQDKSLRRLFQIMIIGAAIQCVYGLGEWFMQKPIWSDYIPPFMRIDPELLAGILGFTSRAGGQYRIASIYLTSLTYAEAISIMLPFVMHAVFVARQTWLRFAAAALVIFLIVNGHLTDARSATIGSAVGVLGIIGLWGLRRYYTHYKERDIIAPALLSLYGFFVVVLTIGVLFFPRLNRMVFGGVEHAGSTESRDQQWAIAWQRLEANPFGYGPFQAADVVGFRNGEFLTLDSYYINLLVDYGFVGFILFMGFFIIGFGMAVRCYVLAETEEEKIAAPIAVALLSFVIIKSVLSQTENHYLAYTLVGAVAALHWRQVQRTAKTAAARAAPDAVEGGQIARPGAPGYGPGAGYGPTPGYGLAPTR